MVYFLLFFLGGVMNQGRDIVAVTYGSERQTKTFSARQKTMDEMITGLVTLPF
jgi:hypothetical protein